MTEQLFIPAEARPPVSEELARHAWAVAERLIEICRPTINAETAAVQGKVKQP